MLMGQRNSEETPYNLIDNNRLDLVDAVELKRELIDTKKRLSEVEGKFNKIKVRARLLSSLIEHKN
jgi:hypothetical protein